MLCVHLLGEFRLVYDDAPLASVNTARVQALLAYLLLHRQAPQSRQHLAFRLWPDAPEARARSNLRNVLYLLQRALPATNRFLEADAQVLQWRPAAAMRLDVAEFETSITAADQAEHGGDQPAVRAALEQAVTLYRGDVLPACYDDWIVPERERLRALFAGALERLVQLLECQGDYRAALTHAQRWVRHDPLHEAIYRRLMRLHAALGDRAGALRVYHTCVAVLECELGVEPSAATQDAYARLLNTDLAAALAANGARPDAVPPEATPHNLPVRLTSFIGRERELPEVKQLFWTTQLLTLTGPGGCGKTRLALQIAADLMAMPACTDGVWWVELAAVTDPALVPQAVASALGVREQPGTTLTEVLVDYLRPKQLLLLLDNCEHLAPACATLATALLRVCPRLRILVTSREALKIAGELAWLVPPLALPPPQRLRGAVTRPVAGGHPPNRVAPEPPSALTAYDALHLFVVRALDTLPTFMPTNQNVAAVARVCHRLDGLPLAIELAAARVKVLTVAQIAERLEDTFQLLTHGSPTGPARHQTLRATIDWSYNLLSEREQTLFRRLSAFAGGFTLQAAEAVCAGVGLHEEEVLDLLSDLVDKSLVVVAQRDEGTEARYRLLETVRQYSRKKLRAAGEEHAIGWRHANFFLQLAEAAEPELKGPHQRIWLNRLELEHDNLRATFAWSLAAGKVEAGLRLAGSLWRFWWIRGYISEGRERLAAVLAQAEGLDLPAARARALKAAGRLAYYQADYAAARTFAERSVTIYRQAGDTAGLASALIALAGPAFDQGDYAAARALYGESLALARTLTDRWGIARCLSNLASVTWAEKDYALASSLQQESLKILRDLEDRWGIAHSLQILGNIYRYQGEYAAVRAAVEESVATFRELGDKWGIAFALSSLGDVDRAQHNYSGACACYKERLAILYDIGDKDGISFALDAFAFVAVAREQPVRAARLFGAAQVLREVIHTSLPPAGLVEYDHSLVAIRAQLDEEAFGAAWAAGRAMALEQAIGYALAEATPDG